MAQVLTSCLHLEQIVDYEPMAHGTMRVRKRRILGEQGGVLAALGGRMYTIYMKHFELLG